MAKENLNVRWIKRNIKEGLPTDCCKSNLRLLEWYCNGSYGLIEIKLGGETLIEEGAKNLKRLANKIDTTKMKHPSFMMVLTAVGQYAYLRKDGVMVVPIGCLKD